MIFKNSVVISATIILLSFPLASDAGLDIDVGPFDFRIGGGFGGGDFIEDPICEAIRDRDLVELFLVAENQESKEGKGQEEVSRLIVEPYTLGFNDKKELILRGYHIKEFALPENVKRDEKDEDKEEGSGIVGGVYTIFKGDQTKQDIKIQHIRDIRVLDNTDFAVRGKSEFGKETDSEIKQVLCTLQ
jgi:hypothetical protein